MNNNVNQTGIPSIDKPWLKFYTEEAKNSKLPDCTLWEYLYENNKNRLDSYAMNYFGNKLTYKELFSKIEEVAKGFLSLGVKSGDIVTIVSISNPSCIISLYALNRIGAVANFVNVLAEEKDFEIYFEDAQSDYIVTLDLFGEKVCNAAKKCGVKKVVTFSLREFMPFGISMGFKFKTRKLDMSFKNDEMVIEWKDFIKAGKSVELGNCKKNPNELCVLGHTGGTTGFPKSVLLNDCQMNAVAHQYKYGMEHKQGERFLHVLVPFVIYGLLTGMHMPLSLGLEVVIIPKFNAREWNSYFKKYRPEHIAATPGYVLPMLEDEAVKKMDLSFIRTLAVGGDGMNETNERKFNDFLHNLGCKVNVTKGYGMTEVCATALTEYSTCNKVGSVGIPLFKNTVKIFDNENQKELGYGEIGEVCINSPSLMLGYKDNEQATKDFTRIHDDGMQWVHTGDLGYINEEGFVFLVGRMKRIIMTSKEGIAYKVFPNIPEEIIVSNEAVKQVCIVSAMDGINEVLKAFVVVDPSKNTDEKQIEKVLRSLCEKELPDYSRPTFYEFKESLPLTPAGKVDFKLLEKEAKEKIA